MEKFAGLLLSTELDFSLLMFGCAYFLLFGLLPVLFGSKAPYGKFSDHLGVSLPSAAGWIIQESPAFLFPLAAMVYHLCLGEVSGEKLIKLATFTVHYANRSLIFPWKTKERVPILICMSAAFFCSYNGFMQAHAILIQEDSGPTHHWRIIAGLFIFIAGMTINISSDRILQNLLAPGQSGYVIPRGGLFNWLSCPNYAGEILEWWGFALLAGTNAGLWFACWTSLFLGSRAMQTHKFYNEKFKEDYPTNRKAFIPFIL